MSNNPGTVMASAVDSQMAQFRELQGELATLRGDLGTVLGQETENELVLLELDELTGESKVYKLLGPVLLPQDLSEAQQTVKKRLEFIRSEKERLERKVADTEVRGNALASKIQQLQAGLQQTTADAVRAIAQEHGGAVGGA
jgi:prefoldin beta subunit